MAILPNNLPLAQKENEENDQPLRQRAPPKKTNVLGTSRHHRHANSPIRKNNGSLLMKKQRQAAEQAAADVLSKQQHNISDTRRHTHWKDEQGNNTSAGIISPASLAHNLNAGLVEQGWSNEGNGVYIHDGSPPHDDNERFHEYDDVSLLEDNASNGGSFSPESFSSQQNQRTRGPFKRRVLAPSLDNPTSIPASASFPSERSLGINSYRSGDCARRIIRRPNYYSAQTKRRVVVLSCAIGLALLGYFVEIRQIMSSTSSTTSIIDGGSHGDMSLPQAFPGSIMGKGGSYAAGKIRDAAGRETDNEVQRAFVSMEAEREHVNSLHKSRAEKRRLRTMPPVALPTSAAFGAASTAVTDSATDEKNGKLMPPPPRLTLDLPAHRELEEENGMADGRRFFQSASGGKNVNKNNSNFRRQLKGQEVAETEICGAQALEASQLYPNNYPPTAHIGPKSRVVVTGALSQVGMELVLQLYENCNVGFIVGIDAAYPNTRAQRLDMIENRYKFLQRRVPGFQRLIVPFFGVHPHPKMGEEIKFEKMNQGFDLVQRLKPTHIVHLAGMEEGQGEYTDYGDTVDASPFAETGKRSMMRRFESLLSMDQVLSSVAKGKIAPPQIVYVSSNEANGSSGVPFTGSSSGEASDTTTSDTTHTPHPASVYGTSSLLKEVLASYYHRQHGLDSVGLRVPTVFGPFLRPGSFLNDLTERTVRNAAGNSEGLPKYHRERDQYSEPASNKSEREGVASGEKEEIAFVSDVAAAVVSAMQFKKDYNALEINPSGPTLIRLGSRLTTSMKVLKESMEKFLPPASPDYSAAVEVREHTEKVADDNDLDLSIYNDERNRNLLGWTHKTTLHKGIKFMLAWQIAKLYPFGLPHDIPNQIEGMIEDSLSFISYHHLSCASGCRWNSVCDESPWDAVIERTKEITKNCPNVLYTVDFRKELVNFEKQSAPSQRKGWEETFCKIAFVSSSSILAKSIYSVDSGDDWNGTEKSGNWIVVYLFGTHYNMYEQEKSLAKLSPQNLFHNTVERAMFVNHRRVVITTDQAMGVMNHMKMKERTEPKKRTIQDKKTKEDMDIWLPPQSHRQSVLFTNKYSFEEGFDTSSARKLGNFVMTNSGIAETRGIREQITFYEQTSHLTRDNMMRSPNYQALFQENFFPYDFLQSNWLVHELKSEEGRSLRCEIFEEHALWGNSEMEDLSIGFVLAKRKVNMQMGKIADHQFEGPEDWYPLLVPKELDDEDAITEGPAYLDYLEAAQKTATDKRGHEYYVTFLPQRLKK